MKKLAAWLTLFTFFIGSSLLTSSLQHPASASSSPASAPSAAKNIVYGYLRVKVKCSRNPDRYMVLYSQVFGYDLDKMSSTDMEQQCGYAPEVKQSMRAACGGQIEAFGVSCSGGMTSLQIANKVRDDSMARANREYNTRASEFFSTCAASIYH